jgi:hypothetical protein
MAKLEGQDMPYVAVIGVSAFICWSYEMTRVPLSEIIVKNCGLLQNSGLERGTIMGRRRQNA